MPEVMRRRRQELGMSQAALGEAAGIDTRSIRRYEAGQNQPVLSAAVSLAKALKISLIELAGGLDSDVNIDGLWWASWQTWNKGSQIITLQQVRIVHTGDTIEIETLSRGNVSLEEGGYHWRGELRLWDNEILMGWYVARDNSVRSKGTLYLVLHPHGQQMEGRWVGMSHDGKVVSGAAAIARSEEAAKTTVTDRAGEYAKH